MPMIPLRLTLVVGPGDGSGGPDHAITFSVPSDSQAGFTPTPAQVTKLQTAMNQFSVAVSNNGTPL